MMTYRTAAVLLAAVCAAALPAHLSAQRGFGPSIEGSLGAYRGAGGNFVERGGVAMDAVVSVPVSRTPAGSLVVGLAAGVTGPLAKDLDCVNGPNGECIQDYPTFASVAALAGLQRSFGGGFSARALAGPAVYYAAGGDRALGLQGRADVATPVFGHVAVVASVRGNVMPDYQGAPLRFAAFGLGLRIHY
jgi:hypothetical protein